MKKVAVVTGANRGLGFETCRQLAKKDYAVILTARDAKKGEAAANTLKKENLDVHFHDLDVDSATSIDKLASFVREKFGRCDVLVNNAGILPGGLGASTSSAMTETTDFLRKGFETNVLGAYQLIQKIAPMMMKQKYGRIVNVSSGMGQLVEMQGGYPAYRISKTALNAITRIFSEELAQWNIHVNSICPGWVKTDMGGPEAERTIPQGADTIVWAATLGDDGPTGSFLRDREIIQW